MFKFETPKGPALIESEMVFAIIPSGVLPGMWPSGPEDVEPPDGERAVVMTKVGTGIPSVETPAALIARYEADALEHAATRPDMPKLLQIVVETIRRGQEAKAQPGPEVRS